MTAWHRVAAAAGVALALAAPLRAQRPAPRSLPALPDTSGWGVYVLAAVEAPDGAVWVGTYGEGIFRLPAGAARWEQIRSDTTATSISWNFVDALAFGPRGEVWYGTVGNGWGLSTDGGAHWRNWALKQLGPEWQYVAPGAIVTRGDTTVIGTADGLQITADDGAHWTAIGDTVGPRARGPADRALALLPSEYVLRLWRARAGGVGFTTLRGAGQLVGGKEWRVRLAPATPPPSDVVTLRGRRYRMTHCGLQRADRAPQRCLPAIAPPADAPALPRTAWFRRPIDRTDNSRIDETYRFGSTMGGNFQAHQGIEFNNPDGTPVHAIGGGQVVYAGPAEAGALTVAIRHDTTIVRDGRPVPIYSVYYHNSALLVHVGDRVRAGAVISLVGNTGRATNDHLHLEVHASPTDSVGAIVDSLQRYPPYNTNPELWIAPLPGTGIVAGRVVDSTGRAVPQARIYGLTMPQPAETPLSFVETYGPRNHAHPLYGEQFAIGDIPAGAYTLGVDIDGRRVFRRVRVSAGRLTWVEFR